MAYVFVHSATGTKGYDKSEDPIQVLEHDIPIDIQYYIDHQLRKPLKRIFKYIIPNATDMLFSMGMSDCGRWRAHEESVGGEAREGRDGGFLQDSTHVSGMQNRY